MSRKLKTMDILPLASLSANSDIDSLYHWLLDQTMNIVWNSKTCELINNLRILYTKINILQQVR